ncbi:MAG: Zn-dependent oligopeptidase, partial [Elusimicrobia bacterium]|nr:Zn-dependent oligopeptidase [Elusimicrobiota bacterium]
MTPKAISLLILSGFFLVPNRAWSEGEAPVIAAASVVTARPAGPHFNANPTEQDIRGAFARAKADLERVAAEVVAIPAERRTFNNTLMALEHASARFQEATSAGSIMTAVSPHAGVRRAADAVETESNAFLNAFAMREDIYKAVKEYADKRETLNAENQRLLDKWMRDFRRAGLEQPPERRAQIQRLNSRLTDLAQQFSNNVRDAKDGMDFSPEHLRQMGMSEVYIASLSPSPTDPAKKRVFADSQGPDYLNFMRQSRDADARRRLQHVSHNIAAEKNVPILEEILGLRTQLAQLLGYESFAHYQLDGRMAGSVDNAWNFLVDLKDKLIAQTKTELEELLALKRRDDPTATEVHVWDQWYYEFMMKRERYSLDAEEVRQYFPVETVVKGTLEVYQDLLGVKFSEVPNHEAWHPDVKLYKIEEKTNNKLIGYFFTDLHPREGKRGSAFAAQVITGRETEDGGYQAPVSILVAAFPKASPGIPALLDQRDVEVFFHEFGHIMHQTLTQSRFPTFSGSAVATDFVEAPSQMLENFVWDRQVLDRISGHWQNPSQKIPDALFQKMLAARRYGQATAKMKQIGFAMTDLAFHRATSPIDTTAVMRKIYEGLGLPQWQEGTAFHASFGHIVGGYAAGYYGYLYSEVFAQDMFTRFEQGGVLNPDTGRDYRRSILAKG